MDLFERQEYVQVASAGWNMFLLLYWCHIEETPEH